MVQCGDRTSIILNYEVIRWWEVDSASIVDKYAIHLYTLLPASKDPTVALLKQALEEMFQHYKRYELGHRLMWFYHILRRTDTMPEEEKIIIEKVLKMQYNYAELIKDDPIIQSVLADTWLKGEAEGEARGEARGKAEGEIQATKEAILSVLTARFSALLATQAQPTVASLENVEALKLLFQQLLRLPDEQTVRIVLGLPNE